eukprot:GHVL01041042.1.p1 GENE.GHVL01041042.1~~GHVL01041042.1.p1  ORF type:complete len:167 (+),score=44.78 GHVL01041042.1:571-1071(+)
MECVNLLKPEEVIQFDVESEVDRPGYILSVHNSKKWILLTIRGSSNLSDAFTNLKVNRGGKNHAGMYAAAEALDNLLHETVIRLATENPDYEIIIQGHSLGGGVATLLGILWSKDNILGGMLPENIEKKNEKKNEKKMKKKMNFIIWVDQVDVVGYMHIHFRPLVF